MTGDVALEVTKVVATAETLLDGSASRFIELRRHSFDDDELTGDDGPQDRLLEEFEADFAAAKDALYNAYGDPEGEGEEGDDDIPLAGVFRCATWVVDDSLIYLAAAHEDRELPLLLVVGVLH